MLKACLSRDLSFQYGGMSYYLRADESVLVDPIKNLAYHRDVKYPFEIERGEYELAN